MGLLYGFAPWLVFWLLIGNTSFALAAATAAGVSAVLVSIGRPSHWPSVGLLHMGSVVTFALLAAASVGQPAADRWALAVSYAGALVTTAAGVLTRRSFVTINAAAGQPPAVLASDEFAMLTKRLTTIWIAIFGVSTVSSAIGAGTGSAVALLCWLVPVVLFALGATVSALLPDRMLAGATDIVRKTTFVAYSEATIDELYYLAREHAGREVGGGQEPYDIKVGGAGTPLVGDESRLSWPSTYRVRDLR